MLLLRNIQKGLVFTWTQIYLSEGSTNAPVQTLCVCCLEDVFVEGGLPNQIAPKQGISNVCKEISNYRVKK